MKLLRSKPQQHLFEADKQRLNLLTHHFLNGKRMRIKVLYLGVLRSKTGKSSEDYEIPTGSSLSDLVEMISSKYGESLRDIFKADEKSRLDPSVIATVNGVSKDMTKADGIKLKDEDTVAFMSVISGG